MEIWIAVLASSIWGVINTLVAGWLVHSRTRAEADRTQREAGEIQTRSDATIYESMQKQLQGALERAEIAEDRANEAIDESHRQGHRIMRLIEMFERHVPWDRIVREKLIGLGIPEEEIPPLPQLDPYIVLDPEDDDSLKKKYR